MNIAANRTPDAKSGAKVLRLSVNYRCYEQTHRRVIRGIACASTMILCCFASVRADDETPPSPPPKTVIEELRQEAQQLAPLVKSNAVRRFLEATDELPEVQPRTIHRNKEKGLAYTAEEVAKLSPEERAACTEQEFDARFYYYTAYGSPLVYARPLDIYAEAAGVTDFNGKRVFDFGYGGIGQLRLLASLGANAVGVEVQPVFRALYSQPGDQGIIRGKAGASGSLKLVHGEFPGDEAVREAIGEKFDLVVSKNVLKEGYIHPARETEKRMLIDLGVDDATFVKALYDVLKPGGHVLIYNICPAQAPPDKPYIPWADGHCPFPRGLIESTGFEVREWNRDDQTAILDYWFALGYDEGEPREQLNRDLFAWYTLLRKLRG